MEKELPDSRPGSQAAGCALEGVEQHERVAGQQLPSCVDSTGVGARAAAAAATALARGQFEGGEDIQPNAARNATIPVLVAGIGPVHSCVPLFVRTHREYPTLKQLTYHSVI